MYPQIPQRMSVTAFVLLRTQPEPLFPGESEEFRTRPRARKTPEERRAAYSAIRDVLSAAGKPMTAAEIVKATGIEKVSYQMYSMFEKGELERISIPNPGKTPGALGGRQYVFAYTLAKGERRPE